MRTTMTIKSQSKKGISAQLKQYYGKETYQIKFGKQSYGQGENTLTDHRSQQRIDNQRMQGKHQACKKCSGCGKGNPCPIL